MAHELLAAHRAGRVEVAIGRASDYFGPRGGAQSNLGDRLFPAALAGRPPASSAIPTSRTPTPTFPTSARAWPSSASIPTRPAQVWHLPNDPDTRTTRQLVDIAFRLAGQPRTRLRQISPDGPHRRIANPTLRELLEMQYQFEEPFIVDSSKITNTLGVHATQSNRPSAETLATYRTAATGSQPQPSR